LVSVLVPVRNEAQRLGALLEALAAQEYAGEWEIIFVDDHSEDSTKEILVEFQEKNIHLNIKILNLKNTSGKKAALTAGVEASRAEILLCTDADTKMGENWLAGMASRMADKQIQFVSGPVSFQQKSTSFLGRVFEHLQIVEFASLVGTGAMLVGLGRPHMANGANMAFRRSAFFAVGGYPEAKKIASGDDEFLLARIVEKYGSGSVCFTKNPAACVYAEACPTLGDFVQQRRRWASKWRFHQKPQMALTALLVAAFQALILGVFVLFGIGAISPLAFWAMLGLRFLGEILFLGRVLSFLGYASLVFWVLPWQLLYPFYALGIGVLSQVRGYVWRGRVQR